MNARINFQLVILLTLNFKLLEGFREQVEKCLNAAFNEKKMVHIRDVMKNKNTCVIALIFFIRIKEQSKKSV